MDGRATLYAREMSTVAFSDLLRQGEVERAEGVSMNRIACADGGGTPAGFVVQNGFGTGGRGQDKQKETGSSK